MASNPRFKIPDFFCIFQTNLAMATLGLKEMEKSLWEGREKGLPCWLSQFSRTVWKMQKKIWYYEKWGGRHASFPPRQSVKWRKIHYQLVTRLFWIEMAYCGCVREFQMLAIVKCHMMSFMTPRYSVVD